MLFTIGVVLISLGWGIAWFFGDWFNLNQNIWDKMGGFVFATGVGLSMSSLMIAAIKYLP